MSEVKIGVSAGVGGVDQAINKITASMNKLGASVAKNQGLKFEPTDMKTMARDLDLINKQMKQVIALSPQLRNALKATGQSGSHLSQIDFSKLSTDPRVAQRLRDRAFTHAVRGTALDASLSNDVDEDGNVARPASVPASAGGGAGGGGGGRPPRGHGGDVDGGHGGGGWGRKIWRGIGKGASSFGRGAGGGAGVAGEAASAGIEAGVGAAEGAGMMGAGMMAGVAVLGYAAFKGAEALGKMAAEGIDLAKQSNESADLLKRSMGDLGVSFKELTDGSRVYGKQIGVAGGEFLKLEQLASDASGGLYRSRKDLEDATLSGGSLARAYGLQPSQGVNFVAGMDRINNHTNNKELATSIAEAIINAQGKATPGEVMQAMYGFAAQQNRFNSGSIDLDKFGNAYGSMLSGDTMTADHASSILGQANASMQQMGGTEASRNFTMQAFGSLDPIRAAMRAEGGLFSNGLTDGSGAADIAGYMSQHGSKNWDSQSKGPEGDNFGVVRDAFDKAYAGRGQYGSELELDAEKNYFGLKSYADTASFMNMGNTDHNGINMLLKNAGVKLSDVNSGGLQAISALSKANNLGDLDSLYRNGPDAIRDRGDMSDQDKSRLDTAEDAAKKSGNMQGFLDEMVRTLSGKGQADDDATVQRDIRANIENMKSQIGERLVPYAQKAMEALLAMANKIPGVSIADPSAVDPSRMAPMGYGGGSRPNDRVDQSGVAAGALNSIANGVDGGDAWADGWADKINYRYGQAQGQAWKLNGGVNDGMGQLEGMGVDKAHAAAIMANAAAESSMDPSARNGRTYGLFQWMPDRQADFKKVMGKDIHGSTAKEQIEYMVKSMRAGGEEETPGKDFWSASGGDLAGVFARQVERVDHAGKNGGIRDGIASKLYDGGAPKKPTAADGGFKPDMSIDVLPKPSPDDMSIIEEPASKIPTKDRVASAADAATAAYATKVGAGAGSGALYGPGGDIVINLNQNVTTPGGGTKTKTLSAKVVKPSSSGMQTPQNIQIPG